SSIYVSREWPRLRRIYPYDLVEPAEADVERRVGDQLDDLGFREVAAHLGPERVVDLAVVDRELLGEPDRGPFARAQEVRVFVVDLVNAQRLDPRHRRLLSHGRSMISIQFGFLPMGYSFSFVSLPVAWSIA